MPGRVVLLPRPAPSAVAAAEQLGCDVGAIANSLVFDADGVPLLVLTSGAHRADTALLGAAAAARVRRADPDFVRLHTGQPIGGVAPVGHPAAIRTLVDTWAAAGHPHTVFSTTYAELLELTGGRAVDVER
jgi:prolyl-tRNA editing enzyme YbaK/EbsC (Cys-tRNA(Pro) deacylase)